MKKAIIQRTIVIFSLICMPFGCGKTSGRNSDAGSSKDARSLEDAYVTLDGASCGAGAACIGTMDNTDLTKYIGELAKNYGGPFQGDISDGFGDIKCAQDGNEYMLSLDVIGEMRCTPDLDEQPREIDCHYAFGGILTLEGEFKAGDDVARKINCVIEIQNYREGLVVAQISYQFVDEDYSLYQESFIKNTDIDSMDDTIKSFYWSKAHKGKSNIPDGASEACSLSVTSHESPSVSPGDSGF